MIFAWGTNSHGQLGLAVKNEQVEVPTKVNNKMDITVTNISCGGGHTLILDKEGRLFSCGWNHKLQSGQSGESLEFQRVWPLSGIEFVKIACGWDFSCGVTKDNFLFVWGSNSHGQLGLPKEHFGDIVKPVRLQIIAEIVSMGLRHAAIVNSKAEVWVSGCGRHGQLGLGSNVLSCDRFKKVIKLGKISHLACGQNCTIAWSSEEKALYVWGDNKHGQLLLNTDKYKKIFDPQKIDIDVKQGVKKLLCGWTNALLWLENGNLLTWGRNNYGQLGNSSMEQFGKLVQVFLPEGRQVKEIALGSEHTVCLASDNTLWAWGWNEHANTGTGSGEAVYVPTLVSMDSNYFITQVYAGGGHNFIITSNQKCLSDNISKDNNIAMIT